MTFTVTARLRPPLTTAAVVWLLVVAAPLSAQTLNVWDGSNTVANGVVDGGTGTWDALTTNWTNADGTINQAYVTDLARFGGTTGTVTLGTNRSANGLEFLTNGYTITGSGNTLSLIPGSGVAVPFVSVDAGVTATIAARIVALSGFTKVNTGTLIVTATNNFWSGPVTIDAGTLQFGNGMGVIASLPLSVVNNGTMIVNHTGSVTTGISISGTGGFVKQGTGTYTINGDSTYTGGTTVSGGVFQIGLGSIVGDVVNNAVVRFNRATGAAWFAGDISGTGSFFKLGASTLTLTGTNSYAGTTTISAGTLQIGNGGTTGTLGTGAVTNNGTLRFNRSDAITIANTITGLGTLQQAGTGTTTLAGLVTVAATDVSAGTLLANGTLTSPVTVASGATLGGAGTIVGNVTINSGATLAPGTSPATLTVGSLSLNGGSLLEYELATPGVVGGGVNDLIVVTADLTLAGTLNVTPLGGFGAGTYRLFDYGGTFTDNGLMFRVLPATFGYQLQTSTSGQVNLLVSDPSAAPDPIQSWDGAQTVGNGVINGGSGIWSTMTNWTNASGTVNQAWGGQTAVFGGMSGTVTVLGEITFNGLQFLSNGYSIVGDAGASLNTATPDTAVLLAPGVVASVAVPINGTGGLTIQGTGTLVLAADNNYTGGTSIGSGSTLQLGNGGTSGAVVGAIANDGTLSVNRADTFVLGGTISGSGSVVQSGRGTLVLSGINTYSGGTHIATGTLSISSDANLGAASGPVTLSGGTLRTTDTFTSARAMTLTASAGIEPVAGTTLLLEGTVSGTGRLTMLGSGVLALSGANTYTGGTTIARGALQLGTCGTSGSIAGDIRNDGTLIFNRADTFTFDGAISGSGTVVKECAGTTILTSANTYAGGTLVKAGTLQGDALSLQGRIINNAAVVFDQTSNGTFQGTLFGTGTLAKTGSATLRLSGNHGLRGPTTVESGTLELDGRLLGSVTVAGPGTLSSNGFIGGALLVNGAVVIPQTSSGEPGYLGVAGNVTFMPGSELRVSLDGSGRSSALVTGGRASIGGTIIRMDADGRALTRVSQFAVVESVSGLAGTASVSSVAPTLESYLSQDENTLFMTVLRLDLPLQPFAGTANGWAIGGVLDRIKANAAGDLRAMTRELTALDDRQLSRALDVISGEIYASSTLLAALDGEAVTDIVRSEVGQRITPRGRREQGLGGSTRSLWGPSRRRAWVRFRGERASFDPLASTSELGGLEPAHGATSTAEGFAGGVDWSLSETWLVGVAGGYATGEMSLDLIEQRSDFSAPRATGYVGYAQGRWRLHSGVSVARTGYDVTRRLEFAAINPTGRPLFSPVDRVAHGSPSGPATDVWVEGRLDLPLGSWDMQPVTGFRSAWLHRNAWSESGAESLSLAAPSQTINSMQADIGLRLVRAIGRFNPFVEGVYRRELGAGDTHASLWLSDQTSGQFDVGGLALAPDSVLGRGGVTFLTNSVGLSVLYEWRQSRQQTKHSLHAGVGF